MSTKDEACVWPPRSDAMDMDPDALIELAQSELGLAPPSPFLCELCWAIAAHCASRGHPGDWDRIEVSHLLDALESGYTVQDLAALIDLWTELIAWMSAVDLLGGAQQQAYQAHTRAWLMRRRRAYRSLDAILDKLSQTAGPARFAGEKFPKGS